MDYKYTLNESLLAEILLKIESGTENSKELIEEANSLVIQLTDDISQLVVTLKQVFSTKFPELDSFGLSPEHYSKTVSLIGNKTDLTDIDLSFLRPATVLALSVTAATTNTNLLSESNLEKCMDLTRQIEELDSKRKKLVIFLESQMLILAPNVTAIVGPTVAAQIIGKARGIKQLARIPSCNLMVIGSARRSLTGFSLSTQSPHTGYIYECDIVQNAPEEFRKKMQKMVAAKSTLAARADAINEYPDGSMGLKYREEILQKLKKMQEPDPLRKPKAIPVPPQKAKQRRGGRRARKMKEIYAMTDVRKHQNKIAFGVEEKEIIVGDTVKGLGVMAGQSGRVRGLANNNKLREFTKKSVKVNQNQSSGMTTSVAFTPVQGMAFPCPEVKTEEIKIQSKWFSSSSGYKRKLEE